MEKKQPTDEELFAELQKLPDFERYALPASWFKKFNLKPLEAQNPKQYLADNWYVRCQAMPRSELGPIIFNEPQPGGVRPVLPAEDIPMTIETKPVDSK